MRDQQAPRAGGHGTAATSYLWGLGPRPHCGLVRSTKNTVLQMIFSDDGSVRSSPQASAGPEGSKRNPRGHPRPARLPAGDASLRQLVPSLTARLRGRKDSHPHPQRNCRKQISSHGQAPSARRLLHLGEGKNASSTANTMLLTSLNLVLAKSWPSRWAHWLCRMGSCAAPWTPRRGTRPGLHSHSCRKSQC